MIRQELLGRIGIASAIGFDGVFCDWRCCLSLARFQTTES
jgi:hypothetical protein